MTNPTPHGQAPEALRLAECLERDCGMNWPDYDNQMNAAEELRRLHAENERLSCLCDKWNSECDEFREDNKRLAAALVEAQQPAPPAEQQTQHGAVYAELPYGLPAYDRFGNQIQAHWTIEQMRDFADRTHALRMEQAAPKAAPGKRLPREQIREVFMAHGFTIKEGQTDLKQYVYDAAHALLELVAAPQQEAQEPYAYAVYFPDQPKVELVHDLDELIDDLTNRTHVVTKLYTASQPAPDCHHRPPCYECAALPLRGDPVPVCGRRCSAHSRQALLGGLRRKPGTTRARTTTATS